ncbi:unnamed protein product [Phytomonas sp. Hart1]|nr:unnamed protein product [Phytomonas sp. Hart1]|eukprot:CCW71947.1 unnamed protein product [Phytomonas sp. isolate Hart1]
MTSLVRPHQTPLMFWLLFCLCLWNTFVNYGGADEVVINEDNIIREARFTVPDAIKILNDTNFDELVFPSRLNTTEAASPKGSPRSWFIFIYSPWCDLCKGMLPHFLDAGISLTQDDASGAHAQMALLNAYTSPKLRGRLKIKYYPTLLYTTGEPPYWGEFHGSHTLESFRSFAKSLQTSVNTGAFMETITDVARFARETRKDGRVPILVVLPTDPRGGPVNLTDSPWAIAIKAAFTLANTRFGLLAADAMGEEGATANREVVEAAKACGGTGAVVVSFTDRVRGPRCYAGPWLDPLLAPPFISAGLTAFLLQHGFHAVEELNGALVETLVTGQTGLLGILFTNGTLGQDDRDYLPVLRAITQRWNEEWEAKGLPLEEAWRAPRVTWAQVDGSTYDHWLTRYQVAPEEMPALLILDPVRTRLYRVRTRVPDLEAIKLQTPWEIGGVQERLLEQFIRDVVAGKYYGEKLSAATALAERLSYVPGLEQVYRLLGYDDFVFVFVISCVGFFMFLLFMALVVEPLATRLLDNPKKLKTD